MICECCGSKINKEDYTVTKVSLTEVTIDLRTTDRTVCWTVCSVCFIDCQEAVWNVYELARSQRMENAET